MEKFEIVDPRFGAAGAGTFDEIVDMIISYNSTWETDYKREDFRNTARGLLCRDELIAVSISEAARTLGRKGGQAKSEKKTIAARRNAKKGGWPKGKPRKKEE